MAVNPGCLISSRRRNEVFEAGAPLDDVGARRVASVANQPERRGAEPQR